MAIIEPSPTGSRKPSTRTAIVAGICLLLLLAPHITLVSLLLSLLAFGVGYWVAVPNANVVKEDTSKWKDILQSRYREASVSDSEKGSTLTTVNQTSPKSSDKVKSKHPALVTTTLPVIPLPRPLNTLPLLDPHLNAFAEYVVRDFISTWYAQLGSLGQVGHNVEPAEEFPNAIRGAMNRIMMNCVGYAQRSDPVELAVLVGYCVSNMLIVHMREFRLYESTGQPLKTYLQENPTSFLADLASPKVQATSLRSISSFLISRLLPPTEAQSPIVSSILKEVVAISALSPIVDAISNTEKINQSILNAFNDEEDDRESESEDDAISDLKHSRQPTDDEPYNTQPLEGQQSDFAMVDPGMEFNIPTTGTQKRGQSKITGKKPNAERHSSKNINSRHSTILTANKSPKKTAVKTTVESVRDKNAPQPSSMDDHTVPTSFATPPSTLQKNTPFLPILSLSDVLDRQEAFDIFQLYLDEVAEQNQTPIPAYLTFWNNTSSYAHFSLALSLTVDASSHDVKQLDNGDPGLAADIFKDHFGPNARYPIPVPSDLVIHLKNSIQSGAPGGGCFSAVRKHVKGVLSETYWNGFLKSKECLNHSQNVGRMAPGSDRGSVIAKEIVEDIAVAAINHQTPNAGFVRTETSTSTPKFDLVTPGSSPPPNTSSLLLSNKHTGTTANPFSDDQKQNKSVAYHAGKMTDNNPSAEPNSNARAEISLLEASTSDLENCSPAPVLSGTQAMPSIGPSPLPVRYRRRRASSLVLLNVQTPQQSEIVNMKSVPFTRQKRAMSLSVKDFETRKRSPTDSLSSAKKVKYSELPRTFSMAFTGHLPEWEDTDVKKDDTESFLALKRDITILGLSIEKCGDGEKNVARKQRLINARTEKSRRLKEYMEGIRRNSSVKRMEVQVDRDNSLEEHPDSATYSPTAHELPTEGLSTTEEKNNDISLAEMTIRVTDTTDPSAFGTTMALDRSIIYIVEIERLRSAGSGGWMVTRSYAAFVALNADLREEFPKIGKVRFPARNRLGGGVASLKLAAELQDWINFLITDGSLREAEVLKTFLRPDQSILSVPGVSAGRTASMVFKAPVKAATSMLKKLGLESPSVTNRPRNKEPFGFMSFRERSESFARLMLNGVGSTSKTELGLVSEQSSDDSSGIRKSSESAMWTPEPDTPEPVVKSRNPSSNRSTRTSLDEVPAMEAKMAYVESPEDDTASTVRDSVLLPSKRSEFDVTTAGPDMATLSSIPSTNTSTSSSEVVLEAPDDLSDHELDLLLETSFAVLEETFDLAGSSTWLRRKALNVVKQLLRQTYGSQINKAVGEYVRSYAKEEVYAKLAKKFMDEIWPNGNPYQWTQGNSLDSSIRASATLSDEDKENLRREAKLLFVEGSPDTLQRMVGTYNCQAGMTRLFNLLQHQILVRGILIQILDGVVRLVFR